MFGLEYFFLIIQYNHKDIKRDRNFLFFMIFRAGFIWKIDLVKMANVSGVVRCSSGPYKNESYQSKPCANESYKKSNDNEC